MNTMKLIVGCMALFACIASAQEMSAEWYRQKEASWARTKQDFPQSAYPGSFKTRILEIDAWAKANDQNLYYNPNKPYLLAQMVKQERDESLAVEQQAARERLRLADLQRAATTTQRSMSEKTPENLFENDPNFSAIFRRHNSPQTTTFGIASIVIVSVAFGVAYLAYRILRPKSGSRTPVALGRTWLAWTVAFATICMLPTFFIFHYSSSIAQWFLVLLLLGIPSFVLGWIVGLIKYRGDKGTDTNAEDSPNPSENPFFNTQGNHEFYNTLPEQHFHPNEPEIKSAPPIMKNTEYEVVVPEGKELEDGYVQMRHNTQYSLNLKNHRRVPCDAEVTIDGIYVGTWRVESRDEICIERPVHNTGHFTFFEVGTEEAGRAGIVNNSDNGLISVTFKPKKESHGLNAAPLTGRGLGAGATGLTGESQQRFRDASEIEHDMARAFTIHLRLVSRRPDIRPLAPRSTPIPPPVG